MKRNNSYERFMKLDPQKRKNLNFQHCCEDMDRWDIACRNGNGNPSNKDLQWHYKYSKKYGGSFWRWLNEVGLREVE